MNELVEQLAARTGIDRSSSQMAIGMMLGFIRTEGPADTTQALIDAIPGAHEAIKASSKDHHHALMGGGLMALSSRLMRLGLGIGDIQDAARDLFATGRAKIGPERMDAIIAETPVLSHLA